MDALVSFLVEDRGGSACHGWPGYAAAASRAAKGPTDSGPAPGPVDRGTLTLLGILLQRGTKVLASRIPFLMIVLRPLAWQAAVRWILLSIQQPQAGLRQLLVIECEYLFPCWRLAGLRLGLLRGRLFQPLQLVVVFEALNELLRCAQRLAPLGAFHLEGCAVKPNFAVYAHLAEEGGEVSGEICSLDRALDQVLVVELGLVVGVLGFPFGSTAPRHSALRPRRAPSLLSPSLILTALEARGPESQLGLQRLLGMCHAARAPPQHRSDARECAMTERRLPREPIVLRLGAHRSRQQRGRL